MNEDCAIIKAFNMRYATVVTICMSVLPYMQVLSSAYIARVTSDAIVGKSFIKRTNNNGSFTESCGVLF